MPVLQAYVTMQRIIYFKYYYKAMCDHKVKPYWKDLVEYREDASIFALL